MVAQGIGANGWMSEDEQRGPNLSAETERRREAQRRRLAEALRENLQKRKQQTRGRAEPTD
jgi:hypothetical protein